MELTTQQLEMLSELAGRIDGLHYPVRGTGDNSRPNQAEMLTRFRKHGIPLVSGRGGEADRKAGERARAELAEMKLVRIVRSKVQVTGWTLTDLGAEVAADATDSWTLFETRELLDRVYELRTSPDGFDAGGFFWVNECSLCEADYAQTGKKSELEKLASLTLELLPALVAGHAVANSDMYRRVWYGASLDMSAPPSTFIDPDHRTVGGRHFEPSDACVDAWIRGRDAMRNHLATATPLNRGELGMIPVSCSPPLRRFINRTSGTLTPPTPTPALRRRK